MVRKVPGLKLKETLRRRGLVIPATGVCAVGDCRVTLGGGVELLL